MKKAWGIIKKGIVTIVGLAVFYGAQGLILLLIAGTIPFLDSCGYSKDDMKQAKLEAYKSGYSDAEWENQDRENDAYKEGYSDAMRDYCVEDTRGVRCPHCGIVIVTDINGEIEDYYWE